MPTFLPITAPYPPAGNYGDITFTGGAGATINANVVTNADLAQVPANTVKGNLTNATANVTDVAVSDLANAISAPIGINYVVDPLGSVLLGASGLDQLDANDLYLQGSEFAQL